MRKWGFLCLALLFVAALPGGCGVIGGADGPMEVQVSGITATLDP